MITSDGKLDEIFGALANPTRRALLERLTDGPAPLRDLAAPSFGMTIQGVSKHLKILENAGLVRRERSGQMRPALLRIEGWRDARGWIDRYQRLVEESYARLDALVSDDPNPLSEIEQER
jgi:DNA-binding transcriptional ArsR family regulator